MAMRASARMSTAAMCGSAKVAAAANMAGAAATEVSAAVYMTATTAEVSGRGMHRGRRKVRRSRVHGRR
jgi:hypothetical protein